MALVSKNETHIVGLSISYGFVISVLRTYDGAYVIVCDIRYFHNGSSRVFPTCIMWTSSCMRTFLDGLNVYQK